MNAAPRIFVVTFNADVVGSPANFTHALSRNEGTILHVERAPDGLSSYIIRVTVDEETLRSDLRLRMGSRVYLRIDAPTEEQLLSLGARGLL
jgi:hypothetical protein